MDSITYDPVKLTQQLIRTESTNPGTYEEETGRFIYDFLKGTGLEPERSEVERNRFNIRAAIKGRKAGPALVFICHMDTVVKGEGWDGDAFSGEIRGGRIYGRGACDMKAGLACALAVFAGTAHAVKEGMMELEFPLMFIGTVDEEGDMKGVEKVIADHWVTKDDWIADLEPTDGNIQMAHKGRTWFELEVQGVTAHASMPEKGADAIAGMASVLTYIRSKIKECPVHEELGHSTVTFGQISGGYSPYVVPDSCRATVDMRLVPPMNTAKAADMIRSAIRFGENEVPGIRGSYRITGDRPGIETHEGSILLKELGKAVEETTGKAPRITPFPGYTDTAVIAGKLGNSNCISYGPGSLKQAHKPNEFVDTTDIDRCQEVFWGLVKNMLTASRAL